MKYCTDLYLNIRNPWAFSALMAVTFIAIIFTWLLACGFLFKIPLIAYFTVNALKYILGYIVGLFASSWAFLCLLEPNATFFTSFCQTLQAHFQVAPMLYTFHLLLLCALIYWSWSFYQGLMGRTTGRVKITIKICAILVLIILVVIIVWVLFEDVITAYCQNQPNASPKSRWFGWLYDSAGSLTPCEAATKIAEITHQVDTQSSIYCRNLPLEEARVCWKMHDLYKNSLQKINLVVLQIPTKPEVTGFQAGIQNVTETVLTPAAQEALAGAAKGAGEALVQMARPL